MDIRLAALLLAALLPGCGNWAGFGFDARGPEMPRIREVLRLERGMTVADIGAGKGELAAALAGEVGSDGRIFATDIDRDRIEALRAKFAREKLGNVVVVEGGASETRLPRACCDAIILRRAYHHLTQPKEMNASLREALRPGGVLAIIDLPPILGHGVRSDRVIAEVTRSGFELVGLVEDWPGPWVLDTYCAIFRRTP
jgi:ubiquinone/menaquinone biosynthesis C-methylase UbiE